MLKQQQSPPQRTGESQVACMSSNVLDAEFTAAGLLKPEGILTAMRSNDVALLSICTTCCVASSAEHAGH